MEVRAPEVRTLAARSHDARTQEARTQEERAQEERTHEKRIQEKRTQEIRTQDRASTCLQPWPWGRLQAKLQGLHIVGDFGAQSLPKYVNLGPGAWAQSSGPKAEVW